MLNLLKQHRTFDGLTQFWSHESTSTKTKMKFSTFTPDGEVKGCLIWLSGLTCNEENFITKSGAQKYLSEHNLMVVAPDTSPRNLELPGEHDSYDFGSGAGFYLDAKTEGYCDHYNMYSYVVSELISLIEKKFDIENFSIFGHSMGGHGALIIGLKNSNLFRSISAFSPIVNPTDTDWGKKAFLGYLGSDEILWEQYDATKLIKSGFSHPCKLLIDQGASDDFLGKELFPEVFEKACVENGQAIELNLREGYDHSYYFISTFIEEHISFHSHYLGLQ